MANKNRLAQNDILDKILADNECSRHSNNNHRHSQEDSEEGAWITSKEQFDRLYKSVDDIERYLRS